MTNPVIDIYGNKNWYDENGFSHREGGPATIYSFGEEYWLRHGKLHRLDGPAVIYHSGQEDWYVNGKLIDILPILEKLDISPDWKSWTEEEKFLVRLALS